MTPLHFRDAGAPRGRAVPTGGLAFLLLCAGLIGSGCAQARQAEFDSPDTAVQSLVTALRGNDEAALRNILGGNSDEILSSGDKVADQQTRANFLEAYDQKNQFVPGANDTVTLVVGPEDWPMPIPIQKDRNSGKWWFDTDAGRDEMINRRIGQNELDVIEVCRAFVDAQYEYARSDHNGDGVAEYAQKLWSDPGTRNGLYWETKPDEPASPMGPFVAAAVEEGYPSTPPARGEPRPYHGYYYRLLKSQGAHAPGGEQDYVVNGKMIGGFAVVAYPADYGNSGIMTFIANHQGSVFQKDLGPNTTRLAKDMWAFDPDASWKSVDPPATAPSKP
jgi:hypothetical protein